MHGQLELALPERYAVRQVVGRGGMATVWEAEDTLLGRKVAVKVLGEHLSADPAAARRFQREARAAARVSNNQHVVAIYDVGETDGRPYIVLEFLSGGSVGDHVRGGRPVPPAQVVEWMRGTAEALDAAHAAGIVHRDVKPANLLLDGEGRVHVADFGIARLASEAALTSSGQLLGTAHYISPEQAEGEPATPASDRYSLAVVAFELLTGTRPWADGTPAAVLRMHAEEAPPRASERNPSLPPAVDEILERGMAKRPGDRWLTAGAFAQALGHALSTARETSPAPDKTAVLPVRERARERPLAAAAGAGAGAAGAGALAAEAAPAAAAVPPKKAAKAPPLTDDVQRRARSGRLLVPALAIAVLLVAGVIGLTRHNGGGKSPQTTARSVSEQTPAPKPKKHPKPKATTPAPAPAPTPTPAAAPTPAPAPTPTATASPAALNDKGYALEQAGQYSAAIPYLRQAVAAGPSSGLTYAYALFNLAHALRLSGNPQAAIPLLEQRLKIPDQTDVVQRELDAARAAAGQTTSGSAAPAPSDHVPPGHAKHPDKHGGH